MNEMSLELNVGNDCFVLVACKDNKVLLFISYKG